MSEKDLRDSARRNGRRAYWAGREKHVNPMRSQSSRAAWDQGWVEEAEWHSASKSIMHRYARERPVPGVKRSSSVPGAELRMENAFGCCVHAWIAGDVWPGEVIPKTFQCSVCGNVADLEDVGDDIRIVWRGTGVLFLGRGLVR